MNNKGFTLLEMVVVVIVVSVLFLLTIPNVSNVISSVDVKACDALTKVVDSAIAQFKLDYGSMPSSIEDLVNAGYLTKQQATCGNGKILILQDGHGIAY